MQTESTRPDRVAHAIVAALAVVTVALGWTSQRSKSMTFDETVYITAGRAYVATGDYRLNPEHPPLSKLLAGAALGAVGAPSVDTTSAAWAAGDQWTVARAYFDRAGPDTAGLVSTARLPTLLLTGLVVVLAFALGARLFDVRAGVLAALLCAFSPNLLAHGRLATTDLPLACFFLAAALAALVIADRPSLPALAAGGAALALALASKYSALLLLGLMPAWVLGSRLLRGGRPLPVWLAGQAGSDSPARRLGGWLGAGAVTLAVAALLLSATYQAPGRIDIYARNLGVLYSNVHLDLPPYFAGTFHHEGLWYYFPGVLLVKAPLALLLLLAVRVGDQVVRRDAEPVALLFLVLPAAGWLAAMMLTALPYGVRYLLPMLPLLLVYVAGLASKPRFRSGAGLAVLLVLAASFVGASLRAYPHYLPFFNSIAGGPAGGIEWLDDHNVDWGQDLPLLAEYLTRRGIDDATLVPMAGYDPGLYGVPGTVRGPGEVLPLLQRPSPPPGVYAVGAHLLTRARWNGRPAIDPLTDLEPAVILGHSIYVFDLRAP